MAPSGGGAAARVGAGILLTRILGFVRERVFAHYFGDGPAADAFRAALRIPNVIRNLLGEGTLSASFIPVYTGMLERGEPDAARRLASVIASLLVLLTAAAALAGIALAPLITAFVAPGFSGEVRRLTITLVEIMFPMSGVLILSAWCLGVLNTHGRFFLSYAAPALWNVAQIGTLVALGGLLLDARLAVALAWGALAGSLLQLGAQLPTALALAGRIAWSVRLATPGVGRVIAAWAPVVFGAGVYQISSVIDTQLASLLPQGAVAILGYAQLVALLPVSLFGVSIAAVALPELSRDAATASHDVLRERLAAGARRVGFFVIPSALAFAALGEELIGALFQTGAFGADETAIAGAVLAAYAIGVPAQSSLKLFASGHYALGDTKTPVRIAALSVAVSAGSAYLLMQRLGPAGIAAGASIGAYLNMTLNFGTLSRRVGRILDRPARRAILLGMAAALPATGTAVLVARTLDTAPLWLMAAAALAAFGLVYGGTCLALRHPDAQRLVGRAGGTRDGERELR